MHADILPDFDLAIQPRFTAENVNKSLPPFLYSSLVTGINGENIIYRQQAILKKPPHHILSLITKKPVNY